MSVEQYSPLDPTIPFFSNHKTIPREEYASGGAEFVIAFLLKFKAIAKRIKITNRTARPLLIYFNNDRENPSNLVANTSSNNSTTRTFNQWTRSIRIVVPDDNVNGIDLEIEYDAVPVQYLPPRDRV